MNQDGNAGKVMVLFRLVQAHSGPASGGRDNDSGRWHKRDEGRKSRCLQIVVSNNCKIKM